VTSGDDGLQLKSIIKSALWPARAEMVARCCIHGDHEAPVATCSCGLYAVADLGSVPLHDPSRSVLGCVALWGTVVEGELGWRAARGYPVILFADPSFDEHTGHQLGERYGVPVFTLPARLSASLFRHSPRLGEFAQVVRELATRPRRPTRHPHTTPDPALGLAVGELLREIHQADLSRRRESRTRRAKRALVPMLLMITAVLSAALTGWPVAMFRHATAPPASVAWSQRVPRAVATRETIVENVPSLDTLLLSRDGEIGAVTYFNRTAEVWNMPGGGFRRVPVAGPALGYGDLALTPDGRTLISAAGGNEIRIYDTATGSLRATLPTGDVSYLAMSPDGHTLAHGGFDKDSTIYLWNIDTKTKIGTIKTNRLRSSAMAFNSDGTKLASGGAYDAVWVWDVPSGAQIAKMPPVQEMIPGVAYPPEHFFYQIAFSPDGHTLATESGGEGLRLWDLTTRRQIAPLQVPDEPVSGLGGLTFSPDGTVLAVGTNHGIQLWNVATHSLIPTRLPGAMGRVIAFLPDGNSLLALAEDGTLDKWSLTEG
jgi:outer membrane protein assembly factor BamB